MNKKMNFGQNKIANQNGENQQLLSVPVANATLLLLLVGVATNSYFPFHLRMHLYYCY
jgi:hypothetical protein